VLRVLVDGAIYGLQKSGGISRYFSETLVRLGRNCDGIQIILHLPRHCQATIPRANWIREIKDFEIMPQKISRVIFGDVSKSVTNARLRMLRPQVFHSTYYTLPYSARIKSVVTVHDFIHEKFPALMGNSHCFIEQKRRVIEAASAIIAVSRNTKEDVLKYTKADETKITVIHHGINDAFFVSSPSELTSCKFWKNYKINNPYWLYVGYRGFYKNFGTLLRAFVRIAPQTEGYLIAVGGEPKLEPWQVDLLIKNRLEKHVLHLHATDDDLRILYSGAAAFVFPSLEEGFGIPLLEAMACGAPIVASDIPVFREVAADSALYFDPYDEEALAEAMKKVLDEDVRLDFIERGHNRVSAFSWEFAASKLGDVYKSLL